METFNSNKAYLFTLGEWEIIDNPAEQMYGKPDEEWEHEELLKISGYKELRGFIIDKESIKIDVYTAECIDLSPSTDIEAPYPFMVEMSLGSLPNKTIFAPNLPSLIMLLNQLSSLAGNW